jgi:hypothetical protein
MLLGDFLAAMFEAMVREGVCPCVLRNYEGFPTGSTTRDIDFLVSPSNLPNAMRALRSIEGIRIIGYSERPYVVMVFVEGIDRGLETRALEIDFDLSLTWKGLPYLSTEAVLNASIARQAGKMSFHVPSPHHEAIISLFTGLLVLRQLKSRYFAQARQTFTTDRAAVRDAMALQFGAKATERLMDAVINDDRGKVMNCRRQLCASLMIRNLRKGPVRSVVAIARHYQNEFALRYSPKTLTTVWILSQEESATKMVTERLFSMLEFAANIVQKAPLESKALEGQRDLKLETSASSDGRDTGRTGHLIANAARFVLREWRFVFSGRRNLTLRICDGSFYHGFTGHREGPAAITLWLTRLLGRLLPAPDLLLVIGVPDYSERKDGKNTASADTTRDFVAFRAFAKTRGRCVVLAANQPANKIEEAAYAAIIDMLSVRSNEAMKNRF